MRIANTIDDSIVDGEGMRFVVFTQGCPHRCPGCHNPETHDVSGGTEITADELFARIERNPLCSGLTLSGGEPFLHAAECAELAAKVQASGRDVWCYTGYTLEELRAAHNADWEKLLAYTDVLIDGRFIEELKSFSHKWRGSSNQKIHRLKPTSNPRL
ncbi:MAG: anaerobic ribonucleoside-triphosphate reductase activating protein [Oscillospiraceae bacterium]|jgi:anaerobic ribonucleoside-triphosphate reductase activating protein|nr:anaerobic ribonucleoside-triphosphate reductase activating protein [Oscillospiraceae bacterium]